MSVVFSVITITYNAAPVLQRTLDSVARQTYEGSGAHHRGRSVERRDGSHGEKVQGAV